ncbi:sulfatase-like hydrolase/transferase [Kiritimatiellota bacterium B12222]|nr:sulfatase-like hydrolase/transferase [Kiritimatiellota bacterium B12222]
MNILFLMCDQLRADHVGWHALSKCETPQLDRLASQGTVFDRCTSVSPVCTPARCGVLTGKYPHQLSMLRMSGDLSPQHPTYARALQEAGYYTAGIGKFHWLQTWPWSRSRGAGLDLASMHEEFKAFGFDEVWEATGKQLVVKNRCDWAVALEEQGLLEGVRDFVEAEGPNSNFAKDVKFTGKAWPFPSELYSDVVTTDKAVEVLRTRPDDHPFMLFASLCSPHAPFDPPAEYLEKEPYLEVDDFRGKGADLDAETKQRMYRLRRSYKAMVRLVDDQVGRLLDELEAQNLMENTLIVFTSDHGEMLGDHARFQKSSWYKESATVPLVIRHPQDLQARRIKSPVELTDITATILDAAGVDPQAALSKRWPAFHDRVPCKSLLPLVTGQTDRLRDFVFSEYETWSMIETEEWKYIREKGSEDPSRPHERLFHVSEDPEETQNVIMDPAFKEVLDLARLRLAWVLDETPAAQTTWATLMPEG